MAFGFTDKSVTKDDWVDLAPISEQVYHPILQATTNSQLCSGGTNAEDQEHSSSWDLWGIVQKPLNWIYPSGGTSSADQKEDSVDSAANTNKYAMAASDQKKPWILEKAGGAVKSVKTLIQSKRGDPDDSWTHLGLDEGLQVHSDKHQQKDDEDVFSIVLREKTELQTKNTRLLKKIAELERKVKERDSQIERKDNELKNLQTRREKPHAFQRQNSYEMAVTSGKTKDQEIRSLRRQVDNLESAGEQHVLEVSRKDEEIRQMKEHIERLQYQKSAAETDAANISEQVKHFEIQYRTEKEYSQRLRVEIEQLQQQLDVAPQAESDDKGSHDDESGARTIARLQSRIKQLTEDVNKLREHSLEQSRAVLNLRQQAEMSKHMQDQVQSMEGLLSEAERERDYYRSLVSESNGECHRRTGQDLTDFQSQLKDKDSQLQRLTEENQKLKDTLTQAEAQVLVYKTDFEEERRDRERIHGLVDDLKKKTSQAEGLAAEERAAYKQELDNVNQDFDYAKEQLHKHKVLLANAEKLSQTMIQEARKAKDAADAAKGEAEKYFQEAEKFRESTKFWRNQAEVSQRDVQAKASQVKQYAKEVERLKKKVEEHKMQQNASKESMKILMDMHDKLTKERDQLKKQNDQLVKQNEQLKKKRKRSTDKLLASPNPPPDEDSTLLEIESAQQRADDADKRADVATAKAMEAERRAKEAEKQAKAAGLKHVGAETRALTMEKELDDKYVQAQKMSSEIQRLNHENKQLRLQLSQKNPNSPQPAHMTWPVVEDDKTVGSGSFALAQPLRTSLPQEPSLQRHSVSTEKPAPPSGLNLQSTVPRPHSQKTASVSPITPTSGYSMSGHLSGQVSHGNAPHGITNRRGLIEQSTGHSTHSERVVTATDALHLQNQQRRPVSFPQTVTESTATVTAGQLSRRPLHESQPQLGPKQQRPSNLPPHSSSEMTLPTKGSPQPRAPPHQGVQSPTGTPSINANTSSDSDSDIQPGGDDEYGNQLQRGVDHDIHKQAAAVIKEVSGGRHQIKTDVQCPYDPNLICPMCMKKFRIGEIQKFKRHVNTCDGTDDDIGTGAIGGEDDDLV